MISLGIEGTAHTISCGIVDDERILANSSSVYSPASGGIHPREAANHHFNNVLNVIKSAAEDASLSIKDVDLITFSRGPGLGPCLRVAATSARALSLKWKKPILGVNHPLGHVEIGRKLSGVVDPVMLYVSGGNTQVVAHRMGRYRVFGETMDIGIGNMLDKFARNIGLPFPGGPKIEELAKRGSKLLDLPYSVKGMDTSFSGINTAAMRHIQKEESVEDVSYSIQEVSFSMLVEVLERALYHLDKSEILLAGGVARNSRLRSMVKSMADEAGVESYLTEPRYCMDNGAMIAQAGLLMYRNGARQGIEDTTVDQRFRIDEVDVPWIESESKSLYENRGAEAVIEGTQFFRRPAIRKTRIRKGYRIPELDMAIRIERTRNEYTILRKMQDSGVTVPVIYDIDQDSHSILMQRIEGTTLREFLRTERKYEDLIHSLAEAVSRIHNSKIAHGDLTTSNVMVSGTMYMIDPSMGRYPADPLQMAQDLFLLFESFNSSHPELPELKKLFLEVYRKECSSQAVILKELRSIEMRRRYV